MSGRGISQYDNVWLVTLHDNDGHIIERGLSTDHVRFITVSGKRYLSWIESEADVIALAGQPPTSTVSSTFNIFDPATMAPLYGEARSADGESVMRDFNGHSVVTRMRETDGAAEKTSTVSTGESVFDVHGGMTGLLLAALPLNIGYRARLPGIGDADLDYTEIRVVRQEAVNAGRLGKMSTWAVEVGPSPPRSVYWISKQAPYVIKAMVRTPDGYASWDMLD